MIYMDNAATTMICPAAYRAMMPYLDKQFGNASAGYRIAYVSREAIERSRKIIAGTINAYPEEIFFTSGGTESDNWAIKSIMLQKEEDIFVRRNEMITSTIEHKAVKNTCNYIRNMGAKVIEIGVDRYGMIDLEQLRNTINDSTRMISIMMANNEIGTIEPIAQIGRIAKAENIIFHTDAVQAYGHIPIDVKKMNIDMLSASGHKFGAPKGCGFLYISRNIDVESFIHGGSQEAGRRSGTENVASIVAMGAAAEYQISKMFRNNRRITKLRDYICDGIKRRIDGVRINGSLDCRLPGNISVSIDGVVGAAIVEKIDQFGICISAGSACSAGKGEPSHVLTAIGLSSEEAKSTIRISINENNTFAEADFMMDKLSYVVKKLRNNRR